MRLAAELFAIALLWILWGWPIAATAVAILLLVDAAGRRPSSPPPEIPTLHDRAGEAPRRDV
jgi:cytochrome c-type biogenesis protein CcmH/NrfF